jgi:hypothetical protein
MVPETLTEVAVGRFVDQFGEGFDDLVFGIINILQAVQEKIVHCLNVFAEKAHDSTPLSHDLRVWALRRC